MKRTLLLSLMLALGVISLAAGGALFSNRIPRAEAARSAQEAGDAGQSSASPEAQAQIESLIAEKESRTPAQRKIDSQLFYASKMDRGEPITANVATINTTVTPDAAGNTVVDITARVDNSLLQALENLGARIISSYPRYHSVRAEISLDSLESIAALDDVVFIRPKLEPMVEAEATKAALRSPQFKPRDFAARAAVVRERLAQALSYLSNDDPPMQTNVGRVTSEGDVTHKAARARGTFNVNGSGIKIGVISDGALSIASAQQSGDLPPDVVIIPGQQGGCAQGSVCDEGTAMLEIVYDLAPGAKLFFATANGGPPAFADNIRKLRAAGCDIIVDDISYPTVETPFHDGQPPTVLTQGAIIMQAVNDVTAEGCLYFSSAGNAGNKNDNTSGVWEGDYSEGGPYVGPRPTGNTIVYNAHDFDPSVTIVTSNQITGSPSPAQAGTLFWSDPLAASTNDYDVFVLNSNGTSVVGAGTNIQDGSSPQDPVETFPAAANVSGNRVVVLRKTTAQPRFLHLNTNRGRLQFNTDGQTHGHSSAALAYSTAATPAVGPFPNPFNSTNKVETFSSDGPRRIFYNANNQPYTPGNFSSTGGIVRQKPDITAADGVSVTGAGNFPSPFFGTSAAAPHAAAIAGLFKSFKPSASQAEIRSVFTASAIDIEAPGVDRDSGVGIVMAFEGLQAMGAQGQANLELSTVTATEVGGNANGFIEPGERGSLNVTLANTGLAPATNITATLTTTTPGVTIRPPGTSTYPDIPPNGTGTNTTPFEFLVSSSFSCTQTIQFRLTVNYTGGTSPRVFDFTVQTGGRSATISTTLDTTLPPLSSEYSATTGQQTGRLNRFSPGSSCSITKANPGLAATTGARQFDAYTFQNTSSSPLCVTVTLTASNSNLYSAMYQGSFNPANPTQNFIGDAGSSNTVTQYSVLVPAGATYVVVVHEVNPGGGVGTNYTLQVTLPCQAAPAFSGGTLQFSSPTYSVNEGAGTASITVTRTGGIDGSTSVTYTVGGGTATNGADYFGGSGTLVFNEGETSKTIVIPILEDSLDEPDETVNITLDQVTSGYGTIGSPNTAVLTIVDNDALPTFLINDVTVSEGDAGTTNAVFTVTLTAASGQVVTVNAATADGTAKAGSDYTSVNVTLTFNPGETTKTVTVPIVGDTIGEPDENFFVNLSNPVNATLNDTQGLGTILDSQPTSTVQFGEATYTVSEDSTVVNITVTRTGDTSGPLTVNYGTANGTASSRSDYNGTFGKLRFAPGQTGQTISVPINEDSYVEGTETFTVTLSSPQDGDAALGGQSTTTVQILDDASEPSANPIDDSTIFVRQQYHDFFNREADASGLAFWVNNIESCGANASCRDFKRAETSAAFFLSIEFQESGYFVYRFYQASFGRRIQNTVPLTFEEFQPDAQTVSRGVIIGQPGALEQLEANKQAYALEFVNRPAFTAQYPQSMTPEQFVDALNANTGGSLSTSERNALVAELQASGNSPAGRASVLRKVADDSDFRQRELNRAFVLMQYFGYLRRNPYDSPDTDFSGFNFWLNKLNQFNGDYRRAEMVRAFITSGEYRRRFGQN